MYFLLEKIKNYIFLVSHFLSNDFLPVLISWPLVFLGFCGFSFFYPNYFLTIKIAFVVILLHSFFVFLFFIASFYSRKLVHILAILLLMVFSCGFYELMTSVVLQKSVSLYWFSLFPLLISFFFSSIFFSLYFAIYFGVIGLLFFHYHQTNMLSGHFVFYTTKFIEMSAFFFFLFFSILSCKFISAREKHFYSSQQMRLRERLRENAKKNFLLYHEAYFDLLTGLYNRTMAEKKIFLSIQSAKSKKISLGVLFIDLDGFKKINDTYGHDVGDKILHYAASLLKKYFDCFYFSEKSENFVARISGDEFVVVLVDTTKEKMEAFAQSLSIVHQKGFFVDATKEEKEKKLLRVGFSIGAYLVKGQEAPEQKTFWELTKEQMRFLLFSVADFNMYQAKKNNEESFYFSDYTKDDLKRLEQSLF